MKGTRALCARRGGVHNVRAASGFQSDRVVRWYFLWLSSTAAMNDAARGAMESLARECGLQRGGLGSSLEL